MINIRTMNINDKDSVAEMMREFYASPAVLSNGSEEIFLNDIENCVGDSPYAEGFVIENNGVIAGYAMVAKSYSTEFGKSCIWIEDLYVKEEFRGKGLGKQLLDFIINKYTDCIFRLEAEEENERAINLYKKCGFEVLPYTQLKRDKQL